MVHAHAHPAGIGPDVIDPVGDGLAELAVDEVMHVDLLGLPVGPVLAAAVLIPPDELLFSCPH